MTRTPPKPGKAKSPLGTMGTVAPAVYHPSVPAAAAPPIYRPALSMPASRPVAQLKSALADKPVAKAPPVFRPQTPAKPTVAPFAPTLIRTKPVIQRMIRDDEETGPTVKLSKELSGKYQELELLLQRYCWDYYVDHQVGRYLRIGEALKLPAPDNWGHAGKKSGSSGEAVRAQKNQEHFETWFSTHKTALNSAVVNTGEWKPPSKSKMHSEEKQKEVYEEKQAMKVVKKDNKHARWHAENPTKKCSIVGCTL